MSILSILTQIREFMMIAAPASAAVTLICTIIHKFIRKKEMPLWKILTGFLLVMTVLFIGYLTFFTRTEAYGQYDLHPFRSYREAWNSFSIRNWQLVIFNILVFSPLGFLLPVTFDGMRKGYRTTILGCLFSVGIEAGQYATKLGLCELDDLINNTMGVILGYCVFRILFTFFDDKRFKLIKFLLALIPIGIIVGGFGFIYYTYETQPFGNLPIQYTYQVNTLHTDYRVADDVTFDVESKEGNVYIPKAFNSGQARSFGVNQLNRMNIAGKDHVTVAEPYVFVRRGNYEVTVNMYDRCYTFRCVDPEHVTNHENGKGDMGIANVKSKLTDYEIEIPKKAVLTKPEEGEYLWTIERTEETTEGLSGYMKCLTTVTGEIYEIDYRMMAFDRSVPVKMISEQDAANLLRNGYFYWDTHEVDILTLKVTGVELTYSQDSKGYYQPVYLFHCVINGENRDLVIPACPQKDLTRVAIDQVKEMLHR